MPGGGKRDCEACAFRNGSFFPGLKDEHWRRLLSLRTRRNYGRNNILFYEKNPPLGLFLLCRGRVKIVRSDCGSRQQIVRFISAPDLVGVRSLVAGEPYKATAVVMEDSVLCLIPAGAFWRFVRASPAASLALARRLAQQLGAAEETMTDIALHRLRERLAKYLIRQWARRQAGQSWVVIKESRYEIADSLGSSLEAICRALADFRQRGWIELQGQRLRILNESRLQAVAHMSAS